jgi:hypothetical protein
MLFYYKGLLISVEYVADLCTAVWTADCSILTLSRRQVKLLLSRVNVVDFTASIE